MPKPPTMKELAKRINAHLKAHEADDDWNKYEYVDRKGRLSRLSKLYSANATAAGRWVYVVYVSYQGRSHLSRDEAERYLAWLDEGNRGQHFQALREGG